MKAKDLKIGSPIYRADRDKITTLRVIGLKRVLDDIRISFNGYESEKVVPMEASAIIPERDYESRLYFSVADAQKRQARLREQQIQYAKEALVKAAQYYAETYAKYHDAPLSEPIVV